MVSDLQSVTTCFSISLSPLLRVLLVARTMFCIILALATASGCADARRNEWCAKATRQLYDVFDNIPLDFKQGGEIINIREYFETDEYSSGERPSLPSKQSVSQYGEIRVVFTKVIFNKDEIFDDESDTAIAFAVDPVDLVANGTVTRFRVLMSGRHVIELRLSNVEFEAWLTEHSE
jgi:hypothetical protein